MIFERLDAVAIIFLELNLCNSIVIIQLIQMETDCSYCQKNMINLSPHFFKSNAIKFKLQGSIVRDLWKAFWKKSPGTVGKTFANNYLNARHWIEYSAHYLIFKLWSLFVVHCKFKEIEKFGYWKKVIMLDILLFI